MKNKSGLLLFVLLLLIQHSFAQQMNHKAPEATTDQMQGSFREIPKLEKGFLDATPDHRNDGIPLGKLGVDSGNKAQILKLGEEISDKKHGVYDSFLIVHKDKLVFESYYVRGRINLAHPQASATKAITSLLMGRAIQLGYLTMEDLDKPLVNFLKDLDPSKFVEGAEKITLHKALTMRGGIRISGKQEAEFMKNPDALKGQNFVQTLLRTTQTITQESQNFSYGNFNTRLVMHVIEAVVPGTTKDFIKTELLDKLGIANYKWQNEVDGLPASGWKVSITSRDMVKLGMLAMNNGKWKGEQLISKDYITKATSRILLVGDDDIFGGGKDVSQQGYGYYYWNGDLKSGNKIYYSSSAQGGGGQFIVLVKELDLMVVVTAHNNDGQTLQVIAERVIPAFINGQ